MASPEFGQNRPGYGLKSRLISPEFGRLYNICLDKNNNISSLKMRSVDNQQNKIEITYYNTMKGGLKVAIDQGRGDLEIINHDQDELPVIHI
ncbi:MAG: hypothetical protein AAGF25_00470 [Pseudomonadota bacterium]